MAKRHYNQYEELFSGQHLRLLRVGHVANAGPARLIKTPLNDAAGSPGQDQLIHEYEICRNLDVAGIIRPLANETVEGRTAIVFEDPGGVILARLFATGPVALPLFLDVAIELTDIIGRLHRKSIVHKDIHSGNILVCTDCDPLRVYLTGLGIASLLPGQSVEKAAPDKLEGTLAVMSPEQTGRMNRPVDYRTDFYSMGAVFYQMLTGKLPFPGYDPLALVHAHLAIKPQTPSKINPRIPSMLSDLVLKLLAKDVDDRYRSGAGITADLKRCRDDWHRTGTISAFELACQDVSETFHIPDKLYGRQNEIRTLQAAFERTCNGPVQLVLVTGYAGIGKTELVNQIRRFVFQKKGYFIAGKCDPLNRKIPCTPFVEAISDAVDQLLARPRERIDRARKILAQTLGKQGRVLTDLIPMLSLIIGDQPPVPELPPDQARNRLHLMIQRLFAVISLRGVSMVVFLDDLQWADFSTLKMLETLACDTDLRNVLLIGAYRDQEIDVTHSLPGILEEINDAGGHIQTIALGAMQEDDVQALVSDALNAPLDSLRDFAILCRRKTGGNPFFLKRFLLELVKRKLIFFDAAGKSWQWHADKIGQADVTDNVIELLTRTIVGLDESVQQILKSAASIGSNFDLATLCAISGQSPQKVMDHLWPAIKGDMVMVLPGHRLRFSRGPDGGAVAPRIDDLEDVARVRFKFFHDRIHEASYGLLNSDEKKRMHLQIGRWMLDTCESNELSERIFDVVGQLNHGKALITQPHEREELVLLNHEAAKKAYAMALFESAFDYCQTAISLMPSSSWQKKYELTKEIYLNGMESALAAGRFNELDRWFEIAGKNIRTPFEQIDVYIIKIQKETAAIRHMEAVNACLDILSQLGINLPLKPSEADLAVATQNATALMNRYNIQNFMKQSTITDPLRLAKLRILAASSFAAFFYNPLLQSMMISEGASLSIQHGLCDLSSLFFMEYAINIDRFNGTIEDAYAIGCLGFDLLERFENKESAVRLIWLFHQQILPLKRHFRESVAPLIRNYQEGLETGDTVFAGYSLAVADHFRFFMGEELALVFQKMEISLIALKKIRHQQAMVLTLLCCQAMVNLMGKSEHTCLLRGPFFDEDAVFPKARQDKNDFLLSFGFFHKLMLSVLFESFSGANGLTDHLERSPHLAVLPAFRSRLLLYASLSRMAVCMTLSGQEQADSLERVTANQQQLKSMAEAAPMNYRHQWHLVKAEQDRIEGHILSAEDHYDRAIELAQENGYLQDQALANELAAKFWMGRGKKPIARLYMQQAIDDYTRWGAAAKVRHLKEEHPEYFSQEESRLPVASDTGQVHQVVDLDVMSALRASRTISGEIVLERLIEKFMAVVIENAGATCGRLLLETEGAFYVAAEAGTEQSGQIIRPKRAFSAEEAEHLLPLKLVQYVQRTGKPVVIEDAAANERFGLDPYMVKNRPRSVLCSPIVRKEKIIGLFYLENNLAAGAFTAERLKMLEILSAQIAVSLENARLYEAQRKAEQALKQHRDHLEEQVKERTAQLAVAKEQAETASRSKSAFLANMSHEIRTPMNAVIGFTDIMLKTEVTEQQQVYLQAVKEGGDTLLHLIDDILDLSKIEAGKMELEASDFDPERAVFDVCNLIGPRLAGKPIELLCRIDDEVPAVVQGDPGKFKQVLINLLGNAAKFTEAGEIEISLKVAPRQDEGIKLRVTVRDTGMGIAPEQLENIFSAFEQADGTVTRQFGGTGLGLAISKKLADLMGGDLWVESALGQGSRFHFTAWMKPGEDAPEAGEFDNFALEGKKVLVADDNANNLTILEHYLKPLNMKVTAVNNADEVLPLLLKAAEENDPFDICLLDIHMPKIDGYEVARRIRCSGEPLKKMPLLALFSLAKGDAKGCEDAGFNGFIAKPVMRPQLYRMVQRLLDVEPVLESEPAMAEQDTVEEKLKRPARILLVEDSPTNLMLAENMLTAEGYQVQTAENGQLALDAYTRDPDAFDLILMDVQMPVMDGLTATEKIRQWEGDTALDGTGRRVPIVAMTAGALKGDREKCLRAGMDDYIAKPVSVDKVLKVLSKFTSA